MKVYDGCQVLAKKKEKTQIKGWIELSSLVNRTGSTLSTSVSSFSFNRTGSTLSTSVSSFKLIALIVIEKL